jgi:hypothetical protein
VPRDGPVRVSQDRRHGSQAAEHHPTAMGCQPCEVRLDGLSCWRSQWCGRHRRLRSIEGVSWHR